MSDVLTIRILVDHERGDMQFLAGSLVVLPAVEAANLVAAGRAEFADGGQARQARIIEPQRAVFDTGNRKFEVR